MTDVLFSLYRWAVPELLKVADVKTQNCGKFSIICKLFILLNAKQEKQAHFYDFGMMWQNSLGFHMFLGNFKHIPLRKIASRTIWPAQNNKLLEGMSCPQLSIKACPNTWLPKTNISPTSTNHSRTMSSNGNLLYLQSQSTIQEYKTCSVPSIE